MVDRAALDAARVALEQALSALEVAEEGPCEHCGLARRRNLAEYRMAVEVTAMLRKLRRWAR